MERWRPWHFGNLHAADLVIGEGSPPGHSGKWRIQPVRLFEDHPRTRETGEIVERRYASGQHSVKLGVEDSFLQRMLREPISR